MITNLIEQLYTWAWWPIRFCKQACECLCWLIVIKNKWRNQIETLIAEDIYWRSRSTAHLRHLMIDLQEQSSRLKIKEPRWSEELPKLGCWSTCDWFQDCLEGLQESLYLLCFRLLVLILPSENNLNYTHSKKKVFLEKVWNIVSRSGTEINVLAVPTQEHGSYLNL